MAVIMVSSIVKWFVKGDSLTQEVRNALGTDISNLSKDQINKIAKKIFNNRSTWFFVDTRIRAIESTIKEIVRTKKTYAMANLLLAIKQSPDLQATIKHFKTCLINYKSNPKALGSAQQLIEKNAYTIATHEDYENLLNSDEIAVILKNSDKYDTLLKEYNEFTHEFFGLTDSQAKPQCVYLEIVAKPLMKDIESVVKNYERKLPYEIPNEQRQNYETYYTYGHSLDWGSKQYKMLGAILVADLKRNLLNRFTDEEKETILRVSAGFHFPLSSENIRALASTYVLPDGDNQGGHKFTKEEQAILYKLEGIMAVNEFSLKAKTLLEIVAKENEKILSDFTDVEIQLLPLLFKAKENEKMLSDFTDAEIQLQPPQLFEYRYN